MIVDLFAGPGGWDMGARLAGLEDPLGIESDIDACATRAAAGLRTERSDVCDASIPDALDGLIASPPCTAFSSAGKREARSVVDELCEAMRERRWTWGRDWTYGGEAIGPSYPPPVWLALEAARWAVTTQPEWIAMEQVPPAFPLWQALGDVLIEDGYSVDYAVLNAADYGVPQARRRAILIASRRRTARLPEPTGAPVSMAAATGWSEDDLVGFPRQADAGATIQLGGTAYRARDLFPASGPAPTLTEKARSWQRWTGDRAVPIDPAEAAILQSFPADYPWQGTRSSQFHQIGNAVPPLLAAHVLAAVTGNLSRPDPT